MRFLLTPTIVLLFALTKNSFAAGAVDVASASKVGMTIPVPPITATIVRNDKTPRGMLFSNLPRS